MASLDAKERSMSEATRDPAGKVAVGIEGMTNVGIGGAIIAALLEHGIPSNTAILIGAVVGSIVPVIASFARDWLASKRAKMIPIALALLAFGLAAPQPSHAQVAPDAPKAMSCGGGACNFYLVSGGWSPHSKQVFVGGNAVDFLSGSFGVGMFGASAHGDMNFIGGVCAIPKVRDALSFICPPPVVP